MVAVSSELGERESVAHRMLRSCLLRKEGGMAPTRGERMAFEVEFTKKK